MELIKSFNLLFIVLGMFLLSLSLHFKQENKNLEYGSHGWTENLTTKGKLLFFAGTILALFGASIHLF